MNSHSIVMLLENAPYMSIEARVSTNDDLGEAGTIDVDGCTSLLMRPTSHTQAVHQSWHGSTGADGHHPLLHLPVSTHVLGGFTPSFHPHPPPAWVTKHTTQKYVQDGRARRAKSEVLHMGTAHPTGAFLLVARVTSGTTSS